MPDARVQAAIENWGPRLIANGVDYNDFMRITTAITRWPQWLDAWSATAQGHEEVAARARAEGHMRTAGEAFLRAAVSYHFAKFVWVIDPERNRRCHRGRRRSAVLGPGVARPEGGADRGSVARRRHGRRRTSAARRASGPSPVVILIPGLDSTKEEFHEWEAVFLDRGMATLSLDGPGQGEAGFTVNIRPDYEVAVAAVLDALAERPGLDLDRVGAAGVSLGGYYAPRSAAFEPRIKAVAGVSGPFDLGTVWPSLPALTRETFAHHSGATDEADAQARAASLDLTGVAARIKQPCLVVTGRRDRVIPWEQTKRIADAAPRGEFVLFEGGTHVCNNMPFKYRPLVADWMRDRLG